MGQRAPALTAFERGEEAPATGWGITVAAITILGGALRLYQIGEQPLWLDEAFSWWMARQSLRDLFRLLVTVDHHPPLFYLLLKVWLGWFGDSEGALRLLSALASTTAIPLYARAATKMAGPRIGLVAALLLAIAPFQIQYAQEARMYALLTLTVALVFVALANIVFSSAATGRRTAWLLLSFAEAGAMLTHNTATVLVPVALNGAVVALWWARRRDKSNGIWKKEFRYLWPASQGAALLLWSPWTSGFVRQAQRVESGFWIAPPDLWAVWTTLGTLSFAHLSDWLPQRDYWAWFALILVAVGLWQWRRSMATSAFLLVLWLLPPLVELVVSVRTPIFYDRTLIWTALPYYLLLARGIVWPRDHRRMVRSGWLASALAGWVMLCALGAWNYATTFEKEAWNRAVQFLAGEANSQELVLFHASWAELPFRYYYPDDAPPLRFHGVPADLFEAGELEPPMTHEALPRLHALIENRESVWLVYSHWWYTDPDGLLLDALHSQLDLIDEQRWPGIRVLHFRRP